MVQLDSKVSQPLWLEPTLPYTVAMQRTRRIVPLWLMGLSNATFGLVSGFIVLPLPQMLAAQGVSRRRSPS